MELYQADLGMLEILGNAIAKRDSDTNTHNYRVTIYTIRLAEAIGSIAGEGMQGLIKGALLHDLGKIAISDNILLKPDLLTPEETEVMKTHVQHGVDIIRDYHWLADAVDIVSCHHEKYDGKGFLRGISGGEIPLHARIFAICDVFDALTSKRPYKEPFPFETSLQMIREMRGTHFDPGLVDAFSSIAEGLYAEINKADEGTLKRMLKQLIDRYFEAQVSVPDGGPRAPEAG
jgi:putative nucleotidyltransferase with HDIG domain